MLSANDGGTEFRRIGLTGTLIEGSIGVKHPIWGGTAFGCTVNLQTDDTSL